MNLLLESPEQTNFNPAVMGFAPDRGTRKIGAVPGGADTARCDTPADEVGLHRQRAAFRYQVELRRIFIGVGIAADRYDGIPIGL